MKYWFSLLLLGSALLLVLFFASPLFRNESMQLVTISIGSREFTAEIADEPSEWERGLIGHKPLASGQGMLFVFPVADKRSFWMKGMTFPIDIIWIGQGRVIGFVDRAGPEEEKRRYLSPGPADQVLEISAGERERLGLKVGHIVRIE